MVRLRRCEPRFGARILGVGAYRLVRVVGNDEICARIDSSDAWIRRRSGIVSRRFAGPGETVITMAAEAARKAMAQSGTDPAEVDAVLLATMSFLEQAPAAAPRVADPLGARAVPAPWTSCPSARASATRWAWPIRWSVPATRGMWWWSARGG